MHKVSTWGYTLEDSKVKEADEKVRGGEYPPEVLAKRIHPQRERAHILLCIMACGLSARTHAMKIMKPGCGWSLSVPGVLCARWLAKIDLAIPAEKRAWHESKRGCTMMRITVMGRNHSPPQS